jgi:predicted nucleic acid-binding protein
MNIFCDTSALIKKYIAETGSDKFEKILRKAETVLVSAITEIETISTFKRLLMEKAINEHEYNVVCGDFESDFQYFTIISFDGEIAKNAIRAIETYQLKTLDSIQLGTAMYLKDEIDFFVVCDEKLIKAATKESIKTINPNK